jgi:rare lipoprotein A
MRKSITALFLFSIVALVSSQSQITTNQNVNSTRYYSKGCSAQRVKTKVVVLSKKLKEIVADKMGILILKKRCSCSYYADKFHGRRTASGVPFDRNKYTAAHKKLPFELN